MPAPSVQSSKDWQVVVFGGISMVGAMVSVFSLLAWAGEDYTWSADSCGTAAALPSCSYFLPGHTTAIYIALGVGSIFLLVGLVLALRFWRAKERPF